MSEGRRLQRGGFGAVIFALGLVGTIREVSGDPALDLDIGPYRFNIWLTAAVGGLFIWLALEYQRAARAAPRFVAPVKPGQDGSYHLTLARSDGGDFGYAFPTVYGPRGWFSRGRDWGLPRNTKRASEGVVTYVYPDHYGTVGAAEGPKPVAPGRYRVEWRISMIKDPRAFRGRVERKASFTITEEDNRAAQEAVIPEVFRFRVHAQRDGGVVRMIVKNDDSDAEQNEHHTIVVTDPEGVEHFAPCKAGEFVYPDEYHAGAPDAEAPASPPLLVGPYYFDARLCTTRMWVNAADDTWGHETVLRSFARGELRV